MVNQAEFIAFSRQDAKLFAYCSGNRLHPPLFQDAADVVAATVPDEFQRAVVCAVTAVGMNLHDLLFR